MIYDALTNLPVCVSAFTNLPARSLASTNLPACSPTLWTSPPVVQHAWSTNYEPPCSQHLSSVSTKHTNLLARIPIQEYQDMILPSHIITCSPPSMNLLVHDIASPNPSLTSQHLNTYKKNPLLAPLSPSVA